LDLSVKYKAKLLHFSSSVVYGPRDDKDPLMKEYKYFPSSPLTPRAHYDEGKRFAETLVYTYRQFYGIDAKILRFFTTYGPRMPLFEGHMIPDFIVAAMDNQPLIIYGDENSSSTFCFISDVVDACLKMMASSEAGPFNIGSQDEYKISDIAQQILKMTSSKSEIHYADPLLFMSRLGLPDITMAKEKLQWFPITLLLFKAYFASMEKIAIIIVNYNGREYINDCLGSLLVLDYPKEDSKIFFVDNASADDSVNFVSHNFSQVEIIVNKENLGFAEGNNVAIRKALAENFDYLMLINQDTISEPDFLKKLVAAAESGKQIAAVQPRIMLYPEKDKVNSLGNSIHYLGFGFSSGGYQKFAGNLEPKEIAYASGAAVLFKKEALEKVGLFDPDFFMYHEDLDLGWRLRMAGYKILVVPSAVIFHKYQFSKSIQKYYFMERNRLICLLENYKLATLVLIFPAWLVMEIGLFLFSLKSGFWQDKLRVYGYFFKLNVWRKILRIRRFRRTIRAREDKEIVKFFTGKIEFQEIDNWLLSKVANPMFNLYWLVVRKLIIW
ncbi:MAG: NAD-dependent epimerase/dehydratase family protein, partial [Candidatus Parcubacteria bacterium]|nr:NAD-dependent epimerase/dehydratase family protein [Candidatus Parcubacteria bacterium]